MELLVISFSHKLCAHINMFNKSVALSALKIYFHGKLWKGYTKTINLKYQLQCGMINLNYPMVHIMYQIFKIILSTSSKRIKTGYYLQCFNIPWYVLHYDLLVIHANVMKFVGFS